MEKFLFNINSTSWFHTLKSGKVVKLEVFYLLMAITGSLLAMSIAWEGSRGIEYGTFSRIAMIPFLLFWTQYLIFAIFYGKVSYETEDFFWKTQLWRFKDPGYDLQKSLYPDAEFRLAELEQKWVEHYGETTEDTLANSPWIQGGRVVILIGAIVLGVTLGFIYA